VAEIVKTDAVVTASQSSHSSSSASYVSSGIKSSSSSQNGMAQAVTIFILGVSVAATRTSEICIGISHISQPVSRMHMNIHSRPLLSLLFPMCVICPVQAFPLECLFD